MKRGLLMALFNVLKSTHGCTIPFGFRMGTSCEHQSVSFFKKVQSHFLLAFSEFLLLLLVVMAVMTLSNCTVLHFHSKLS